MSVHSNVPFRCSKVINQNFKNSFKITIGALRKLLGYKSKSGNVLLEDKEQIFDLL